MPDTTHLPEPWLRGTLVDVPAAQRAVLHALQGAEEDLTRWCGELTDTELHQRPAGLPSVGFHLHHIVGSTDRLLTYAEGGELSPAQLADMKAEGTTTGTVRDSLHRVSQALQSASARVRHFTPADLEQPRGVGRKQLPTSVGGLLVHVADHTQRHVGQAITTAKLLLANRTEETETRD